MSKRKLELGEGQREGGSSLPSERRARPGATWVPLGQYFSCQKLTLLMDRHENIKPNSLTVFSPSKSKKLMWQEEASSELNCLVQMVSRLSGSVSAPTHGLRLREAEASRRACTCLRCAINLAGTMPACVYLSKDMETGSHWTERITQFATGNLNLPAERIKGLWRGSPQAGYGYSLLSLNLNLNN